MTPFRSRRDRTHGKGYRDTCLKVQYYNRHVFDCTILIRIIVVTTRLTGASHMIMAGNGRFKMQPEGPPPLKETKRMTEADLDGSGEQVS